MVSVSLMFAESLPPRLRVNFHPLSNGMDAGKEPRHADKLFPDFLERTLAVRR